MSKPKICVAIPTYQRESVLIDTIKTLLDQSYKEFELLIVDQSKSHTDKTSRALKTISDKRFRYIKATPPSLPAARNFCLKLATAPLILFLDDDIMPTPNLVKNHVEAFEKYPEVSAIAGRVMQEGFPVKKYVLKFDEFAISNGVFTATKAGYTNAFPGGNYSLRVEDALKVGGFDTRYYKNSFREESDMSMKMTRVGMKIYYEPKAEMLHLNVSFGGTRTKPYVDIYDTPIFYRNELFFTLRAAEPGKKIQALRIKYRSYCLAVRHFPAYRRRVLFFLGLIAALWRMVFSRQIITKEVSS